MMYARCTARTTAMTLTCAAACPHLHRPAVADMELGAADGPGGQGGVMAPIATQADEPAHTKKKVADFLNHHTGASGSWG